ncbi:MAG: phosphoenolpyruvate synthase [Candidatus Competibacteraceae bacterium]|jgi:pyruvate,water dikinase|nr:phosphoenolpyruvate synthase [Candidatus Competibacteraceae bacterium]
MQQFKHIKRFIELGVHDVPQVGGKNSSLGEMYRELSAKGIMVPNGFATTADAYRYYIDSNGLHDKIAAELGALDPTDVDALAVSGHKIRDWVRNGSIPQDLADEIVAAYEELSGDQGLVDVAVRSSATAEDLPDASFAGQQETYLNIRGAENLLQTCKRVFASLFTNRAISYRTHQGFKHMDVALSIGVQKMVRSDKASSGVIFTLDTESGFRNAVFITSAYGLGENVVQGAVDPDEIYVFKPTLKEGFKPILKRRRGRKLIKMIYGDDTSVGVSTRNVDVDVRDQEKFSVSDEDALTLARYAVDIEEHYSMKAGKARPMDIEWAKDGYDGKLYIVQARPETVQSGKSAMVHEVFKLDNRGTVLCEGKSVGSKIAAGRARVIASAAQMNEVQPGDILVTDMTDPDWEPVMKVAAAIVTNRGGRTCHAAIISRELGIPAVVGCGNATSLIHDGEEVTASCAEGDVGYVYEGKLPFEKSQIDLTGLGKPKTKIMLNLANPDMAFEVCKLPMEGVGLARLEFIIATGIGVHPNALIDYDKMDRGIRKQIHEKMAGYPSPTEYYVMRLAEGVGTIAASVYPKPVIVRMSDFKSNEYAMLLGGKDYEPHEENPMIGFRGAYRYPSKSFAESFGLECKAIKHVREVMGLTNVKIMIPFVRTLGEADEVLAILAKNGIKRGDNGLEVVCMCEIPANALLADQFLEKFDGFSIGSNDLTQLALGMDRDAGMTGGDERNEAVLMLMEMAIKACKKAGKYIGICGQAPSDFPEITRWLVEQGIESMSLNPDSVLPMTQVVLETEKRLGISD